MKPRAIHTEEEHRQALARIDQLMDAKPGTDDADELDLWVTLISVYEDEHYPIDPPDPVEALKFRMEQQGLRQKDLIPYMGSASKVSEVLTGKRPLSLSMIRRLHQELGIPAEVLLGDRQPTTSLSMESIEWDRFPLREMIKRKWIKFEGSVQEARDTAEQLVKGFIHPFGDELLMPTPTRNRQHVRHGGETDMYALFAWRVQVMHLAQSQQVNNYQSGSIGKDLIRQVAKLSYFDQGPLLAKELLSKCGIHLVVERHLLKTYLDGACMLMPDGKPLIALTLRYDRLDNFWFTLAHELAHVARHLAIETDQSFFDDLDASDETAQEKEADHMACDGLIPSNWWRTANLLSNPHSVAVRNFAEQLRISQSIPAGRIRFETRDFTLLTGLLGNGCVRKVFKV